MRLKTELPLAAVPARQTSIAADPTRLSGHIAASAARFGRRREREASNSPLRMFVART